MDTPQIVMIVMLSLSMFAGLLMHGADTKVNFFATMVSNALVVGVLMWGGFFG